MAVTNWKALLPALLGAALAVASVAGPATAPAGIPLPDPDLSTATTAYPGEVSLFSVPDGSGKSPAACYAFGGTVVDATITVEVVDAMAEPVRMYPAEDMWLESADGGLIHCIGGTVADGPTDADGRSTWTQPLHAGCQGIETVVLISGMTLAPRLPMRHNSADISCDLRVDISDLVLYAQDNMGYDYRSDFFWDGELDLSDLVLLAVANGRYCP